MLDDQLARALAAREERGTRRRLYMGDADSARWRAACVDFSSNDYLSLACSVRMREALAARTTGVPTGSGGSRLLDGDSPMHTALEVRIAAHFGAPAALLFNSGWDANVSLLTTLPQPGDVVVYDALVHASMHDGMRSSRAAACVPFAHNDPAALDAALGAVLREHPLPRNVFLALESVYSMDGTVCRLRELLAVLARHVPDGLCHVLVDEAHAAGVYGARGRGVCAALDVAVAMRLVTFGKALGCAGAAVLCPSLWREYLLNYARPLIYSTALSPPAVLAMDVAMDELASGRADVRAAQLHARTRQLYGALGRVHAGPLPPAPIVAIRTCDARALAAHLQAAGYFVRAVCYPTVPRGEDRVRICVHTDNTLVQIHGLVGALRDGGGDGGGGERRAWRSGGHDQRAAGHVQAAVAQGRSGTGGAPRDSPSADDARHLPAAL
ncbi:8-amino-7-oxononanoate synthase [Malassezia sp. CBS 17886]|nr:8-amino-7-oxononanoate synthase [Malassezia sp. CBS 17886]